MRCKISLGAAVAIFFALSVTICVGAENDAGPHIFFPQTHHEFAPVLEDTTVVHDFVIQNKGNAMLNVDRVKTG